MVVNSQCVTKVLEDLKIVKLGNVTWLVIYFQWNVLTKHTDHFTTRDVRIWNQKS